MNHEKKVNDWIKAGLKTYHIFDDSQEFIEFTESGMMKYLLKTFEHTVRCNFTCFVFDLKTRI